jgi:hypothetical protein
MLLYPPFPLFLSGKGVKKITAVYLSQGVIMSTITYFEKPGPVNTDKTLSLAAERAKELSIATILLASSSGTNALKAAVLFP